MDNNVMNNETASKPRKEGGIIGKLIVGSVLGLLLFCIPLPWGGGSSKMLLSFIKESIEGATGKILPTVALAIMAISFFGTLYALATKKKEHSEFFKDCFSPSAVNIIV